MNFPKRQSASPLSSSSTLRAAGGLLAVLALTACGGGDGEPIVYECLPGQACGGSGDDEPLPSQIIACTGSDNKELTVNPKTITIHNNSDTDTIYPVLATSKNAVNEWIQGCFRTTELYPTNYVYKLYVNEGEGLPPGSSATLTLPLYTELAPNALPGADKEARYITWWNGGRVVLADEDERLLDKRDAGSNPNGHDIAFAAPKNVTCEGEGAQCRLTTYYSDVQFPENIYAQLSEYTFGDSIIPAANAPRVLKPENVGYNISYVDHVYMPVAIGPKSNPYIGYSGSVEPLAAFRAGLSEFLASPVGDGWPVYNLSKLKLPGGYNIFAQRSGTLPPTDNVPVKPKDGFPPVLTVLKCLDANNPCSEDEKRSLHFGAAVQHMQNLWGSCVSDWGWTPAQRAEYVTEDVQQCDVPVNDKGLTLRQALTTVRDFFKENHQNYLAMYSDSNSTCTGSQPQVPEFDFWQAITHIYGWVPFNEGCGADANPLADTRIPGWDHAGIQPMYIHDLQYNHLQPSVQNDPRLLFNPYVQLIHDDLKMNAYGFSVDDAVGFMSELGSGLVFTVGGAQGLENTRQFDYANGFSLMLGVPAGMNPNEPLIQSYGVCALNTRPDDPECQNFSQDVLMPGNSLIAGFRVGTVPSYPIRVNFTDTRQRVYSLLVNEPFAKCPDGAALGACPTNRDKIVVQAECIVRQHHLGAKHPDSDRWCASANPNQQKEKQLTKNYLSFATPVDFLP